MFFRSLSRIVCVGVKKSWLVVGNQLLWNRSFTQSPIHSKKKKKLLLVPPLDEADLLEQFVRGSGPGGQAVNKTNNAVSLIHQPTGIRVQAHTHRSREANRNQARRVLAERVDFFLNKGKSQIEKEWKRDQRRKAAKIRKRRKRERLRLEDEQQPLGGSQRNVRPSTIKPNNHSFHPHNRNSSPRNSEPRIPPPSLKKFLN